MACRNARRRSPGELWTFVAFLLICLVVSTAPLANAQSEGLITAGAEDNYPPFSFLDDEGEVTGFSVELMRRALESMDRRVTFRTGPWSEVKGWLERGEVQALPLVGRTPEREPHFDFTFPYCPSTVP
jgi:ABC-type amino acid transport substrate-binding protein